MEASGNKQWSSSYPLDHHFLKDIVRGELWVAVENISQTVVGVAALTTDQPDEYAGRYLYFSC